MAENGFKAHENGKNNSSDENDRSSPEFEEVDGFCVVPNFSSSVSTVKDFADLHGISVVRNLFPSVSTVKDSTDGTRLTIDKGRMSASFKKKEEQSDQKTEEKGIHQKSWKRGRKNEKETSFQNTQAVKHASQAEVQMEDKGVTAAKKQLIFSKQPTTQKCSLRSEIQKAHLKSCKECQKRKDDPQNSQSAAQKPQVKAAVQGLASSSQSAIMQDINLCDKCDCTEEEQPCMQCRVRDYFCEGTCACCEVQRNVYEAMQDMK